MQIRAAFPREPNGEANNKAETEMSMFLAICDMIENDVRFDNERSAIRFQISSFPPLLYNRQLSFSFRHS